MYMALYTWKYYMTKRRVQIAVKFSLKETIVLVLILLALDDKKSERERENSKYMAHKESCNDKNCQANEMRYYTNHQIFIKKILIIYFLI